MQISSSPRSPEELGEGRLVLGSKQLAPTFIRSGPIEAKVYVDSNANDIPSNDVTLRIADQTSGGFAEATFRLDSNLPGMSATVALGKTGPDSESEHRLLCGFDHFEI